MGVPLLPGDCRSSEKPATMIHGSDGTQQDSRRTRTGDDPMRAIISDIHGNIEALEAVLADIARLDVSEIYCLGDVVGYGPNPIECLERSRAWPVVLMGNHDQGVVFDPEGWSPHAERAIIWTRSLLEANRRDDLWEFLSLRPKFHREQGLMFVHGSARNPINEYVFPEDIYNQRKMAQIGRLFDGVCFSGHTHVPGVFLESASGSWGYLAPEEFGGTWHLDGNRTIVNVGSVGQPRDNDPRACYVLLDGSDLTFHRVEYDFETTARKIHAIPDLDNFLGDRLREGR